MNNVNTRVHLIIKSKLEPYSDEWLAILRQRVKRELQAMQRVFSETDFARAIGSVERRQLSLAGVTFLLYIA